MILAIPAGLALDRAFKPALLAGAWLTAVGGASNFTTLLNADHVRGYGFEAELEARPATGLSLTAGL